MFNIANTWMKITRYIANRKYFFSCDKFYNKKIKKTQISTLAFLSHIIIQKSRHIFNEFTLICIIISFFNQIFSKIKIWNFIRYCIERHSKVKITQGIFLF